MKQNINLKIISFRSTYIPSFPCLNNVIHLVYILMEFCHLCVCVCVCVCVCFFFHHSSFFCPPLCPTIKCCLCLVILLSPSSSSSSSQLLFITCYVDVFNIIIFQFHCGFVTWLQSKVVALASLPSGVHWGYFSLMQALKWINCSQILKMSVMFVFGSLLNYKVWSDLKEIYSIGQYSVEFYIKIAMFVFDLLSRLESTTGVLPPPPPPPNNNFDQLYFLFCFVSECFKIRFR